MGKSKTMVIYASPKKNSFTGKLLNRVIEDKNAVTFFDCFEAMPHPCTDCGLCKSHDTCCYADLDLFFNDFENSEEIIFAFPVYNCGLPAPLKALADRFQRFYNARFVRNIKSPISGSRNVTVLMTFGGNCDESEAVLKQLKPLFTISGCKLKKCYVLENTDRLSQSDPVFPKITEY